MNEYFGLFAIQHLVSTRVSDLALCMTLGMIYFNLSGTQNHEGCCIQVYLLCTAQASWTKVVHGNGNRADPP